MKKILFLLFLTYATVLSSCNRIGRAGNTLPTDPTLIHGTLDNGFSYIIKENHYPENRAAFYFVVKAGSLVEEENEQGTAHFLEHMAFNGTKSFPGNSIDHYLSSLGAGFGPDINAWTSFDETVYILSLPLGQDKIIDDAFVIMKEWSQDMLLDEDEALKERGVVYEEWRRGLNASRRIFDLQVPTLLNGSRYSIRLPIGKPEIIQAIDRQKLLQFYKKWYQPQLQAIIAVGDFNGQDIEKRVKETFSPIPRGETSLPEYPVTVSTKKLYQVDRDPELTRSTLSVYYRNQQNEAVAEEESFKQEFTQELINNIFNQRLEIETTNNDSPLVSAWTGDVFFGANQHFFEMGGSYKESRASEAYTTILTILEQASLYGFSEEELAIAKKTLLNGLEQAAKEADHSDSGTLANSYVQAFLSGSTITSAQQDYDLAQKLLKQISLKELDAFLKKLKMGQRISLLSAPEKEQNVPSAEDLEQTANALDINTIKPYVDENYTDEDLYKEPETAGNITRGQHLAEGFTKWTLNNGIEIYLKKTAFKSDEILFYASTNGGYNAVTDSDYYSAQLAIPLVYEQGPGSWNKVTLNKKLAGHTVSLNPFVSKYKKGFEGSASQKDLPFLFEMLYLYTDQAKNDPEAFARIKDRLIEHYQKQVGSPDEAFNKAIYEALYLNGGPRYRYTTVDDIKTTDQARTIAFYDQSFNRSSLASMKFFFVGSLDEKQLQSLAERWLGSLNPQPATYPRIQNVPAANPKPVIVRNGLENQGEVLITYSFSRPYNIYDSPSWAMLRSLADKELFDTVREKFSAVYSPQVYISRQENSNRVDLSISFTFDPARYEELLALTDQSIRKTLSNQLESSYYQEAQAVLLEEEKRNRQSNSYWLGISTGLIEKGIDLSAIERQQELLSSLGQNSMQLFLRQLSQSYTRSVAVRLPG